MKAIGHFPRVCAVLSVLTLICGSAFASSLLIILPYDSTYADTRSDPEWIEIGEMFGNYKELTGIETRTITLEELKRWHAGADEAEQVKRTIHSFVRNQGTRYVLLVGDTGVFPIRQQFTGYTAAGDTFYEGTHGAWQPEARDYYRFFPTDAYFSNLWSDDDAPDHFDTWNNNGDHLYGEMYHDALRSQDDFSYRPDVAVGRVPAQTPQEFLDYCVKVMRYETQTRDVAGEQAALLIAGGVSGGLDSIRDLAPFFESDYQLSQLWQTASNYEYDGDFGHGNTDFPEDYIAAFFNLNLPQFVHYAGHGSPTWWAEPGFDDSRASILANHPLPSIITTSACKTAQFAARQHTTFKPLTAPADVDEDGMAEALVTQGSGGGVVYIASTTGVSIPIGYDLWPPFYAAIIDDDVSRIGDAFRRALEHYIDDNGLDSYSDTGSWRDDDSWPGSSGGYYTGSACSSFVPIVTTLLFGDPSLRIQGVDYSLTPPSTRAEYRPWVNRDDLTAGPVHLHEVKFHARDEDTRVVTTYWQAQEAPDSTWSDFYQASETEIDIDLSEVNEGDQLLFSYYSVDAEGSEETLNTDQIGFDFTPPVTAVYVDGVPYPAGSSDAIPFRDVNVELRATDETSGPQYIEYTLGSGTGGTCNPGGRFPVQFNFPCFSGTFMLRFRAVDGAGNVEDWQSVAIELEPVEAARRACLGEWIEAIRDVAPPRYADTLPLLEFFEKSEATEQVEAVRFEFQGPFKTIVQGKAGLGDWRTVGKVEKTGKVWSATWDRLSTGSSVGYFLVRAVPLIEGESKAMSPYWIHINK